MRQHITTLRDAMRLCKSASATLRVTQVELLLTVSLKPGLTQTELATECGVTLAAISRSVDVLGAGGRRDGVSGKLGLIEARRNANDDRILQVFLTPKGEQFVSLLEAMTYGSSLSE
jgi:DNA-binding MarR family transcriptional regulator